MTCGRDDQEHWRRSEQPHDRPVVTVCNAGRVSQTAADVLTGLGFDAWSLTGGMKAWSLAWNTADVPNARGARIIQVRRTGKGCLSYVVGSEAMRPSSIRRFRPRSTWMFAARAGRIRYVLETHIHADHLSQGAPAGRQRAGHARLPDQQRVRFPFTPVHDGDRSRWRSVLSARHTPGHTDESTVVPVGIGAVVSPATRSSSEASDGRICTPRQRRP